MDASLRRRKRATMFRTAGWLAVASMVGLALGGPGAGIASATPSDANGHKVTICHRTNSVTNPYVVITVDYSGADGALVHDSGNGDHTIHLGPVFDFAADPSVAYPPPHNGDQWGDIIPNFSWEGDAQHPGGTFPGLNWGGAGQAIWNAGCTGPTTTTTTTTTSSTTTTGTQTTGTQTTTTTTTTQTTGTQTTGTQTTGTQTTGTQTTGTQTTATGTGSVLGLTATPQRTSGVEAATSKPRSTVAPTSTLPTGGTPASDTWRVALLGLAGLLASVLVLSPRDTDRARRRR